VDDGGSRRTFDDEDNPFEEELDSDILKRERVEEQLRQKREQALEQALNDRVGLTKLVRRIERYMGQIQQAFEQLLRAIRDQTKANRQNREESQALRGELRGALKRMELTTAAPIETLPIRSSQQLGFEPPWTTDPWALRIHGKNGKQARWVALSLIAAAALGFVAYQLGFRRNDFPHGPTPSSSLSVPTGSSSDSE